MTDVKALVERLRDESRDQTEFIAALKGALEAMEHRVETCQNIDNHWLHRRIDYLEAELAEERRMKDAAVAVGKDFEKGFWEARKMYEAAREVAIFNRNQLLADGKEETYARIRSEVDAEIAAKRKEKAKE